jgi:DMSO reductase anchor subunit
LVLMLQLSQMAFGLWVVGGVVLATGALALERAAFLSATVFLHVGLGASVFHLGRPLGAWRFFVGLRTSWMSREILAFGTVSAASMLSLALPEVWPGWVLWSKALKYSTVSGSVVAVWTSVMIYADTRRPGWERWRVALGFLGGGLLLGISGVGLLALLRGENVFGERLGMAAVVWRGALLAAEEWDLRRCRARGGELATVVAFRTAVTPAARWVLLGLNVGCSVLGVFGLLAGEGMVSLTCATVSFAGTMVAELLRRWIFFVGTPAPQMPRSVSGESR